MVATISFDRRMRGKSFSLIMGGLYLTLLQVVVILSRGCEYKIMQLGYGVMACNIVHTRYGLKRHTEEDDQGKPGSE